MVASASLQHFVQHDPESSASPLVRPRHCRCTAPDALPQSSLPRVLLLSGVPAPPRSQRNGVSRSCLCRASVVPRQSSAHPQPRLGCCCRQRRSDRLFLRSNDVSEVPTSRTTGCEILFSTVSPSTSMIWTAVAAAASGCFCRVLIVALKLAFSLALWVPSFDPSFHPLWVRSFQFFSTLVQCLGCWGLFVVLVCPSRPAPRAHGAP